MIRLLYRIFTENRQYNQIKKLVCVFFDGSTIIKAEGVWQGESEHSLIIEIDNSLFSRQCDAERIKQLCYAIKKLNQQDKILVQKIESESKLI